MMAQQGGISQLQQRLTTGNRPQGVPPGAGPAGAPGVPMGGMMPQNPRMAGMVPQPGQVREREEPQTDKLLLTYRVTIHAVPNLLLLKFPFSMRPMYEY